MIVKIINESVSYVDKYTQRLTDIYENAEEYLPDLQYPSDVLDLDKLRNSPDKFRNELTPRIKGLMPIACFSYASVVAKVFYYAGRKGKIYIGLASNSLMDRKNTDKLISTRFVNHCWFESEEGKIYETNLRAPHLYSLRELTPRARTLTYKDNTVVY